MPTTSQKTKASIELVMQIEFIVSGLKPTLRRPSEPRMKHAPISPAVEAIVLAYQIEHAIRNGRARDYADIAKRVGVTRARVSQLQRLLRLPPATIEELLLDDPMRFVKLTERQLRPLTSSSYGKRPRSLELLVPS